MKVNILFAVAISLSLSACKKDDSSPPGESQHSLCFNLDGFNQMLTDLKSGDFRTSEVAPVKDNIRILYYQIFNASGNLVHQIRQTEADPAFGNITDNVPGGDYTVVLVGSKSEVIQVAPTTLTGAKLVSAATDDDIFFKKLQVTVGSSDLTQSVALDRISSFIELNVLDVLPPDVASVDMVVQNEYPTFMFSTGTYQSSGIVEKKVTKVIASDADRTGLKMSACVLNSYTPVTVQIYCYDQDHKALKMVKVANVECVRNKKTVLSGRLFSLPGSGFSVGINAGLSGDPVVVFF